MAGSATSDAIPPRPDWGESEGGGVRSRVSGWLVVLLRPVHWLLMRLYFRVEVVEGGRIPREGPALIVPTHRSRWDPVVLYCASGRLLRFMASHDEFVGVQGWFMRHMGTFPVDTRRPSPGVLRHCRELLHEGRVLVVFAEGTIFYYPPGQVHPIKPGAAWLALDCQERTPGAAIPLIPVRIVYSERYPRFRTRVRILVQEPIHLANYLELPRRTAIRQLTADLQRALGDIVNESLAEMSPPRDGRHDPLSPTRED